MTRIMLRFLLLILLFSPVEVYSQLDISQAKRELARLDDRDTTMIELLLKISDAYGSSNPDSTLKYASIARDLAADAGELYAEARARRSMGYANYLEGDYSSSVMQWNRALEAFEELGKDEDMLQMLGNNAVVMLNAGLDSMAIVYWQRAIQVANDLQDTLSMIVYHHNLGHLYQENRKDFKQAIDYYSVALDLTERIAHDEYIGLSSRTLGLAYLSAGEPDLALKYLLISEEAYSRTSSPEMASTLINLGQYYFKDGKIDQAIQYQERALKLADERRAPILEIQSSLDLADSYSRKGVYQDAIRLYERANREQYNIYSLDEKYRANMGLAAIYKELHMLERSISFYEDALVLKDSIAVIQMNETNSQERIRKEITQEKFETRLELSEVMVEIEKSRALRYRGLILIFVTALILILFFLLMTIRLNRQRRKAHHDLQEQFAITLAQQEEITDSLQYARRIQTAVLPSDEDLNELLPEHFVLFQPRDIVSGDFYWIKKIGNYTVIVVADCTGHGVPGAFMSMLGISMLNELVSRNRFDSAGEILDRLRKKVKSTLSQEGKELEQKDGMDMALAILDNETREMQFAGAFNPIYIIRQKEKDQVGVNKLAQSIDANGHRLYEIKGDRQPIAIYSKEKNFKTVTMKLQKDDALYMFSDGYPDQIGGPREKKFMIKKFKDLMLEIQGLPMIQQREKLSQTLIEWKQEIEQVDDIIVFGIRLN